MPFRRCVLRLTAVTIVVSIGAATTAYADTGNISVAVTRENGRPLAGVQVVVESRDGDIHEATGDAAGRVSLDELETGLYRLTASREGYVSVVEPSLRVVRDKTIEVRLRMRAANEGIEEVVVVAEA